MSRDRTGTPVDNDQGAVHARAEETRAALIEWAKQEVAAGTQRTYDLAKFAFSVSIGTAGIIVSFAKPEKAPMPGIAVASLFLSVASSGFALRAAWPQGWRLDGATDIGKEYKRQMGNDRWMLSVWAGLYFLSVIGVVYTIFVL